MLESAKPCSGSRQRHVLKGKKPDEYAHTFTSHPENRPSENSRPDQVRLLTLHQGNGRATTSVAKAHGTYEHWIWPTLPTGKTGSRLPRPVTPRGHGVVNKTSAGDSQRGQRPLRQRGMRRPAIGKKVSAKEPEDLLSAASDQAIDRKKGHVKQAAT